MTLAKPVSKTSFCNRFTIYTYMNGFYKRMNTNEVSLAHIVNLFFFFFGMVFSGADAPLLNRWSVSTLPD